VSCYAARSASSLPSFADRTFLLGVLGAYRSEKRFEEVTMITRLLLIAVLLGLASSAVAEDAFPSKLITIVVAFPPGGVADLSARPTAHCKKFSSNQ
jgi:hypothetical protein